MVLLTKYTNTPGSSGCCTVVVPPLSPSGHDIQSGPSFWTLGLLGHHSNSQVPSFGLPDLRMTSFLGSWTSRV